MVGALGAEPERPPEPSGPPAETSPTSDEVPAPTPGQEGEIVSSLLPAWNNFSSQDSPPCFAPEPPQAEHPAAAHSGVPVIHNDLFQVTGRMDTADRRGLAARAEFCNRRIDLSASQPAPEPSAPTPVPGPGSVGVFVSAALALLRRRRE
jgi:hypothetical protein